MGGKDQSPLRKTTARRIRDVISIVAYAHCARWLWSFQREFGFNWNTLTMMYGFLWTPRATTLGKGIVYVSFTIGLYGIMRWIIRDYYMEIVCKSMSLISGLKCIYMIVELASALEVTTWAKNIRRQRPFLRGTTTYRR